jgi:hypothetical protein
MNDKTEPLGIIHEAGRVAAGKKEKATYLTPQGRDKLFRYEYPLAWGKKMVSADAFVTGSVRIDLVKRTTTVTIEALDRKTRKLAAVTSFDVRTDRSILTDVCTNFALNTRHIRTMSPDEQEELANKKAQEPGKKKGQPDDRLVDLEILYDNTRMDPVPSAAHPGTAEVPEPLEDTRVVLRLKNLSDRRLAVLVAVNGRNTLYQEDMKQASAGGAATKWVLDPGKQTELLGFYRKDDRSYEPFKVLSKEDSAREEELDTNEHLGAIHLVVFEEGDAAMGEPMIKTQGLRKLLPLAETRPQSAREAADLVRNLKGSVRSQGIIKPDANIKEANLKTVPFKDPKWQETRVIWYYSRSGDK